MGFLLNTRIAFLQCGIRLSHLVPTGFNASILPDPDNKLMNVEHSGGKGNWWGRNWCNRMKPFRIVTSSTANSTRIVLGWKLHPQLWKNTRIFQKIYKDYKEQLKLSKGLEWIKFYKISKQVLLKVKYILILSILQSQTFTILKSKIWYIARTYQRGCQILKLLKVRGITENEGCIKI